MNAQRTAALVAALVVSLVAGCGDKAPDSEVVPEGFTAVPGIGDVAHRDQTMLIFRKGEEVIGVHVTGKFTADMDIEVARLVMSKL